MALSVEELLRPRYKVIADYPNSIFKVGGIIDNIYHWDRLTGFAKYPHLFQPLQWYEDRNIEDLPKYVKINEAEKGSVTIINHGKEPLVHKVKKHWALSIDEDFRYSNYESFISEWNNHAYSYGTFLPATLSEYENQNQ